MINHAEIARGFFELGMIEDAFAELENLGEEAADMMEVIRLKADMLIEQKRWNEAFQMSQRLCESEPRGVQGYIHAAYCLHEMERTSDACDLLLAGPLHLREEPIWLYNLGCYHTVIGKHEEAVDYLEKSFLLDPTLRETAKSDPDLEPLWGQSMQESG